MMIFYPIRMFLLLFYLLAYDHLNIPYMNTIPHYLLPYIYPIFTFVQITYPPYFLMKFKRSRHRHKHFCQHFLEIVTFATVFTIVIVDFIMVPMMAVVMTISNVAGKDNSLSDIGFSDGWIRAVRFFIVLTVNRYNPAWDFGYIDRSLAEEDAFWKILDTQTRSSEEQERLRGLEERQVLEEVLLRSLEEGNAHEMGIGDLGKENEENQEV